MRFSSYFFSKLHFSVPPKKTLKLLFLCFLLPPHPFADSKPFSFSEFFSNIYIDDPILNPKNYLLHNIGKHSDFPLNTIKSFQINKGSQILVVNLNNTLFALHGNCPYDNSKLSTDLLLSDKVFCLTHGSAFCVKNGTLEYGPDFEDLRIYEIVQQHENFFLKIPNNLSHEQGKVINYKKVYGKPSFSRVVFLGNDPGVISCIQTLRMSGFLGFIDLILSMNNNEKPNFGDSKNLNAKLIRENDFFEKMKVNIITDKIVSITPSNNCLQILTPTGQIKRIEYNNLVLANGSHQRIDVKIEENAFKMERLVEFHKIKNLNQQNKKMIIVGSTLNAWNLASTLRRENLNGEIILLSSLNKIQKKFGDKIARNMIQNLQNSGIEFKDISNLTDITYDGENHHIYFQDGSQINGNSVLLQGKTKPNTDFAKQFLKTDKNDGLIMDISLRTSISNIFALGSLISYPLADQGIRVRIPHNMSESVNQGVYVAFNILDNQMSYNMIPFDSISIGKNDYKFIGYYKQFDSFHVVGDLDKNQFLTFYIKDNNVVGACGCGREKDLMILYEGLRNECVPLVEENKIDGNEIIEKTKLELNKRGERNRCIKYETILANLDKVQFT